MIVEIQCTREVKFSKTVEISEAEWFSLEDQNENGMLCRPSISYLEGLIDFVDDLEDAREFENIDIVEVDEDGAVVKDGHSLCWY